MAPLFSSLLDCFNAYASATNRSQPQYRHKAPAVLHKAGIEKFKGCVLGYSLLAPWSLGCLVV